MSLENSPPHGPKADSQRSTLCRRRTLLRAGLAAWPAAWLAGVPLVASAQNASGAPGDHAEPRAHAAALRDPSGFSTVDLDLTDASRQRDVPVRLHLPATASESDPVPLVVFSHGIGGSRRGYSYLGHHWARHGFASLHLQHVGSDRNLWFGSPFGLVGRLHDAAQADEAVARALDFRFALDQVLAGRTGARLDASRIVAAGHSYGANTALLAAGARVERQGRPVGLHDARVKAAVLLSSPPFYGETDMRSILGGVSVPTLHVTATQDIIRIPGYYSGADDRIAVFEAVGGRRKTLAVFEGGSHSMFTDRAGTGGVALNPQVKAATCELSVAFLNSTFRGEDEALQRWPVGFAGILARFTTLAG